MQSNVAHPIVFDLNSRSLHINVSISSVYTFLDFVRKMSLTTYLTRLGAAKRGALCMMEDRGYALSAAEKRQQSDSALAIAHAALSVAQQRNCSLGQALSATYEPPAKSSLRRLAVVFLDRNFDEKKAREVMVSSAQVRKCIEDFAGAQLLLVLPNKLSPDAKKTVALHPSVQAMVCESLFIPLGRHVHVPKHVGLSEDEAREFEAARGIQRYQLPVLLLKDPVAQYYGFAEGAIVRISRADGAFYRTICA